LQVVAVVLALDQVMVEFLKMVVIPDSTQQDCGLKVVELVN
jgi:hypothetical protein